MIKKDDTQSEVPTSFEDAMGPADTIDDDRLLPSPEDLATLQEEIATLSQALKEAQDKATNYWERLIQKEADLQNMLRRAQQDTDKARNFAIEKFASELLAVIDSLEQGMHHGQNLETVNVQDLVEGMRLTHSILLNIFDKEGIQIIDPINEPFNPTFHEAISIQETTEAKPNTVLMVVQKGYILHQRLLRPARVVVSKAPK
jgi:molecular chaperone GrpE